VIRSAIATAGIIVIATFAALAAEDERQALAERVVKARYEADFADRIMDVFWPVALEVVKARAPEATVGQLFLYEAETATFATEIARAGLAPVVDLFARSFTEEELRAVAEFYESPAGKKVLSSEAEITAVISEAAAEDPLTFAPSAMLGPFLDMLAEDGY
jgi:uncharacterized protein